MPSGPSRAESHLLSGWVKQRTRTRLPSAAWRRAASAARSVFPEPDAALDQDAVVLEQAVEDVVPIAEEARLLFGADIARHILSLEGKEHSGSPDFPNEDFTKPFERYLQL